MPLLERRAGEQAAASPYGYSCNHGTDNDGTGEAAYDDGG